MPFYPSPLDNCQLHYVDYAPTSPPALTFIFLHGWPMSSSMFSHLFLPLLSRNIRIIATDRRGFGKSEYAGTQAIEITYDTFAADTVALIRQLSDDRNGNGGLGTFVFVAASMGCGESLLCYDLLPETLREKCKGFIWLGPSLPFPLATPSNPTAPPRELWDAILAGLRGDRYGFTKASMPGIFGHGTIEGVEVGEETLRAFEGIVRMADPVAMERCLEVITGRDFTGQLGALAGRFGKEKEEGALGLLVLHGDCDQGMPYEASSKIIKELVPGAEVKVYEKAAHGLYLTHKAQVLEDMLKFVEKLHA